VVVYRTEKKTGKAKIDGENWCGCSEHMDEMKSKIQITFFFVNEMEPGS
jgi:hypothetical protein